MHKLEKGALEAFLGGLCALPAQLADNEDQVVQFHAGNRLLLSVVSFRYSSCRITMWLPNCFVDQRQIGPIAISSCQVGSVHHSPMVVGTNPHNFCPHVCTAHEETS